MSERNTLEELMMLSLLAAAVLAFFGRAALLQGTFFVQDIMVQNYPFRHFFSQALKQGTLPLWNPAINCGFPLFAEGQAGILYPFNLLAALLLPTYAALNYAIILHFYLAGVGTYLFLRLIGARPSAALAGGLTYACSGFLVVRAMSPNYVAVSAWMPMLFVLVEWAFQRQNWLFLYLASGALGLQLLAGHPQAALYSLLALVAYGLYRGLSARAGWRFLAWIGLGFPLLGAGLAAVQLLPTAELVKMSLRGEGLRWEQFTAMSLPPERLITLLLPNFFGNDATGTYWGKEAGFFIQLCGYGGILPLGLALVALRERRDLQSEFFGALGGLGLVLALGRYTALFTLLYEIPGMSLFRIPTRFLLWFAFALAVLAGLGLERILGTAKDERWRGWWLVGASFLFVGIGMAWLNREVLLAGEEALVRRGGEALVRYGRELRGDLIRLALLLGIGTWAAVCRGGEKRRRVVAATFPLLIFADLFAFGREYNGLIDEEVYHRVPASAQAIWADAGRDRPVPPRILSLISEQNAPYDWHQGWALNQDSYRRYPETLRLYTGGLYGLGNALPGWSPLHLQRHWEFMRGYPAFADLAGIEYVVSYQPLTAPGLRLIHEGQVRVYRNHRALPRAYLVGDFRVIPDKEERLRYMRSARFDPRRQVVLEEPPSFYPHGEGGEVWIERYSAEQVSLRLAAPKGGILVLSETYYPGWRVWVDGREQSVLLANHVFRAVVVPPGARQIEFRYEPASFTLGAWVSMGCWIFLGSLVGVAFHRRLRLRPSPIPARWPLSSWTLQGILIVLIHALATRWPLWIQALERSRVLAHWGG